MSNLALRFSGFVGSNVAPIECFKNVISINDEHFEATIYMVTDDTITMEAVVGNELLSQVEVKLSQNNIIIIKTPKVSGVLSPNYAVELDSSTIDYAVCKEKQREVENLLDSYAVKKIKAFNIEVVITLSENQKIFT